MNSKASSSKLKFFFSSAIQKANKNRRHVDNDATKRKLSTSYDHSFSQGYKGIGSFHSEDVDILMTQSSDEYTVPVLPFEDSQNIQEFCQTDANGDFMIDRTNWTFLNHGAFGAALQSGYKRAEQWRLHLERQPLRYFDRDLMPHLVYSARRLAKFCHAPRETMTLIQNVTSGTNTILKGYTNFVGIDKSQIFLWDTSYGSTKKIANILCPHVTEIPLSSYFSEALHTMDDPETIFDAAFLEAIQKNNKSLEGALLILDHTTSNTAINMPLQRLSKIAKEFGMFVVVDGAHGLLAQEVSMNQLPDIDFYLANGHKWLSAPRGIGMLYCPHTDLRDTVLARPAVMSHGAGQGFQSRFLWDGCRDYAAALAIPAVLDYWEQFGIETTRQKMKNTLDGAVSLLGDMFGHSKKETTLVPLSLHAPMMTLVRLPDSLQKPGPEGATSTDAKMIQDYLYTHFIEVPIKCVNGVLYVRLSCHVYNKLEEYDRLGQILLSLGTGGEGKHRQWYLMKQGRPL